MILRLLLICYIFNSCNGQQREEKQNEKNSMYSAKCEGTYSTGKSVTEDEKNWKLSKSDILSIIKLSQEIDEQDIHFSYPVTPCIIDISHFNVNGRFVNLRINGGSFLSLTENGKTKILGCDDPKCKKYFILPKEEVDDDKFDFKKKLDGYKIDKNNDSIVIKKINESGESTLNIYKNKKVILTKNFSSDRLTIDLNVKYNQLFNLKLEYKDQYGNTFRKITIPIFFKEDNFYIEKLFIESLALSAETGNNELSYKEKLVKIRLKDFDVDKFLE